MMKASIKTLTELRLFASEEDIKKIVMEYMMETIAKANLYDSLPDSAKREERDS